MCDLIPSRFAFVFSLVSLCVPFPLFANDKNTCEQILSRSITSLNHTGFFAKEAQKAAAELSLSLQRIRSIPTAQRSYENTIEAFDNAVDLFNITKVTLSTLSQLTPATSQHQIADRSLFFEIINSAASSYQTDHRIYYAIFNTEVNNVSEAALRNTWLARFRSSGAHLAPKSRHMIAKLNAEAAQLGAQFKASISNDNSRFVINGREIKLADPSDVQDFLTYESDREARKALYLAYRSRQPENEERLLQITRINNTVARILNLDNWLNATIHEGTIAASPKSVEQVLNELKNSYKTASTKYLDELRKLANHHDLMPWDWFYYDRIFKNRQAGGGLPATNLNPEQINRHFPQDKFLARLITFVEQLFQIKFIEEPHAQTWHPSVRVFKVVSLVGTGNEPQDLGRLYMDLEFRPQGKDASTAFVEELVSRRLLSKSSSRLPIGLVACSWKPGYLEIGEIQTALHEMGHALHLMFSQSANFAQSGFSFSQDFMEIPSITLDRLIKVPEVLVTLSDPENPLSVEQAVKLTNQSQSFELVGGDLFSTSHLHNTIFLALLDFEIQKQAGKLDSFADLQKIYHQLFKEFYAIDLPPEDKFLQTFHHIADGYAGAYYSYIWAGLVAANISDRLKQLGGLTSPTAFSALREMVLSKPRSDQSPSAIVEGFLGQSISATPFFKELGWHKPSPSAVERRETPSQTNPASQ